MSPKEAAFPVSSLPSFFSAAGSGAGVADSSPADAVSPAASAFFHGDDLFPPERKWGGAPFASASRRCAASEAERGLRDPAVRKPGNSLRRILRGLFQERKLRGAVRQPGENRSLKPEKIFDFSNFFLLSGIYRMYQKKTAV